MISFGTCKRIGRRQESSVNEAQEERASTQALGRGSTGEVAYLTQKPHGTSSQKREVGYLAYLTLSEACRAPRRKRER